MHDMIPQEFLTRGPTLQDIFDIQDRLAQGTPVEMPATNQWAPHMCIRSLFIPAGTILVGKMHRTEHFNILLKGSITILMDDGPKLFEAPCIFVSKAGTKKIGYAHTDVWYANTHVTETTTEEELEAEVIMPEDRLRDSKTGKLLVDCFEQLQLMLGEV